MVLARIAESPPMPNGHARSCTGSGGVLALKWYWRVVMVAASWDYVQRVSARGALGQIGMDQFFLLHVCGHQSAGVGIEVRDFPCVIANGGWY